MLHGLAAGAAGLGEPLPQGPQRGRAPATWPRARAVAPRSEFGSQDRPNGPLTLDEEVGVEMQPPSLQDVVPWSVPFSTDLHSSWSLEHHFSAPEAYLCQAREPDQTKY